AFTPTLTHDATGGSTGTVGLSSTVRDKTLDCLGSDQALTPAHTVIVTDIKGASSTQLVTITITGTNEAPVITSGDQKGAVIEDTNVDNSGNLNTGGTITFTDVELTHTHTATFPPRGSGYLGTFAHTLTSEASGGSAGTVGWTFSVSDQAVDFLAKDQTLTQTYTVKVADNNGGFTTQDVTITIHGTNDAPVITSGAAAVALSEEGLP